MGRKRKIVEEQIQIGKKRMKMSQQGSRGDEEWEYWKAPPIVIQPIKDEEELRVDEIKREIKDERDGRREGIELAPADDDMKAPITREDLNNLKFYLSEMSKIVQPEEIQYLQQKQKLQQALDIMDMENLYNQHYMYNLAKNKLTTMHDPLLMSLKIQEMDRIKKDISQMPYIQRQLEIYTVEAILNKLPASRIGPARKLFSLTKHQLTWDIHTGTVSLFGYVVHPDSNILAIMDYLQTNPNIRIYIKSPAGVDKVFEYILIKRLQDLIFKPSEDEAVMYETMMVIQNNISKYKKGKGKKRFKESVEDKLIDSLIRLNEWK